MEKKEVENIDKVEKKLLTTSKRILKERKNTKLAVKQEKEFDEIRNLLGQTDKDVFTSERKPLLVEEAPESSTIPLNSPKLNIFNEGLLFSIFNEETICLNNFIAGKELRTSVRKKRLLLSEDAFRKLVASRSIENLMFEEEKESPVSLYILYLMSVHQDSNFVSACFDFLNQCPFHLQLVDIFTIFLNFGAELQDLFCLNQEKTLKNYYRIDGNVDKIPKISQFPYYNVAMVGRILLHYATEDLIEFSHNPKQLVKVLAKIALDLKIQDGSLTSLFSTLLHVICVKVEDMCKVEELAEWLHFKEEHFLIQLNMCYLIPEPILPDLHEVLILKTICHVLKSENLMIHPPSKVDKVKLILLQVLEKRSVLPLELFSILKLINCLLPNFTATFTESNEIIAILNRLDHIISFTKDSVDLIRLKLEVAKVRALIGNHNTSRSALEDSPATSPVKLIKCSK